MRFFFSLPHFLIIIISVVIVYKIIIKVIIDIRIGVNKNDMLNINKNSFLAIIIVLINDNNIE